VHARGVREHRYTLDLPHSVDRLWALMQDYPRWTEYAPMVVRVEVLHPGDARGNGLLRRVIYKMPFGRVGSALELVTDVVSPSEARATNGLAGEPQASPSEARATNGLAGEPQASPSEARATNGLAGEPQASPSEARATNGLAGEPHASPSEARATNGSNGADREPWCGYTYTMISRATGNDQTGRVRLEPVGPRQTRLHFEERYHLVSAPWRWFEGPIYRFINRQNEASMRSLSTWLSGHPEYRPELS